MFNPSKLLVDNRSRVLPNMTKFGSFKYLSIETQGAVKVKLHVFFTETAGGKCLLDWGLGEEGKRVPAPRPYKGVGP